MFWDLLLLMVTGLIAIVPFIRHGILYTGVDMGFHLNRVSEVYNTLKSGHIFSYLNTQSLNNVGAAVNMVYGVLPVYPLAVAMLVVKNKITAIYLGIYILLLLTSVIAYFSAYKFWHSRYKAVLFALLYTYSAYSFDIYFGSFSLGQASAMLFLPMIAYGAYAIFFTNMREWWILSLGMTGVIYTHLLSTLMYSSLVALLFLTALVKQIDVRRYIYFGLAILVTISATLFYWVSFRSIYSDTTIYTTEFKAAITGENLASFSNSLINVILGIVVALAFIISLCAWKKFTVSEKYLAMYALIYAVILTNISNFLWYYLSKTPLKMIQWPGRFRVLLVFLVVALIVSVSDRLFVENFSRRVYCGVLLTLSVLLWLSNSIDFFNARTAYTELDYRPTMTKSLPFVNFKISNTKNYNNIVNKNYNGVGSLDYWPQKATEYYSALEDHRAIINGQTKVVKTSGIVNGVVFKDVTLTQRSKVDLPMLAYGGFKYKVYANKKQIMSGISSRHTVLVDLNKGKYEIKVVYVPNNKIKLAKIISVLTIFILLVYGSLSSCKRDTKTKQSQNISQ